MSLLDFNLSQFLMDQFDCYKFYSNRILHNVHVAVSLNLYQTDNPLS